MMASTSPRRGRKPADIPHGNHFGAWLRARRDERDLTGEALAALIGGGFTQGRISSYETGVKNPERETVRLIAEALAQGQTRVTAEDLERDGLIAAGFAPEGMMLPEIERIPDEDELERRLAAYDGPNPGLRAAQGALAGFLHAVRTSEPVPPPDDL
jgi:transcriptional regulator with XRE-family HTH domain